VARDLSGARGGGGLDWNGQNAKINQGLQSFQRVLLCSGSEAVPMSSTGSERNDWSLQLLVQYRYTGTTSLDVATTARVV
jgi:hypothetical protein